MRSISYMWVLGLAVLAMLSSCRQEQSKTSYGTDKYSTGDEELDRVRVDILNTPTSRENFESRLILMKLWALALQRQGADLGEEYVDVDRRLHEVSRWNSLIHEDGEQYYTDDDIRDLHLIAVDGYRILDSIQRFLIDHPDHFPFGIPSDENIREARVQNIDWPQYKGNENRTGYTGSDGPVHGIIDWKFPVGLTWEAAPVVADGKVYLASPGIRNILEVVDLETGKVEMTARQDVRIKGDQLYSAPQCASTPVIMGDHVLLREMGSRGNLSIAKEVVFINRKTGKIDKEIYAGHIDLRAGNAPFAASEKYLVTPMGIQEIEQWPPLTQALNRIWVSDAETGEKLWHFSLGDMFAEPVLDGERMFIGTQHGDVFSLKMSGDYNYRDAGRIAWQFKAEGGVNRKLAVGKKHVWFGSNRGVIYCLDKETGEKRWSYRVQDPQPRAFRHFSTPLLKDGMLFIGGADSKLYAFHAESGELIFQHETSDWVRARPAATHEHVYVLSLDGTLEKISLPEKEGKPGETGKSVWQKKVGTHQFYADLALEGDRLLMNSSDFYCYCIDLNGKLLWKHSFLKSFYRDGRRIPTDEIAGGGYFMSKPTIVDGTVFIGTPSRFVYALDAATGKEKWKFETGGGICGAPEYYEGKIYFGQQGGEEEYYCLDAETGLPVWTQRIGWVWGSCNVGDGMVFIPGIDGYVNGLDAETGHIIWRHRTGRSTCSEPLVIGDYVYFGAWDAFERKFNKYTGELIWKHHLGGSSDSGSPIGYGNRLYLPVGGGKFRCLDAETAEILWIPNLEPESFNVTPAYYHDKGIVYISTLEGVGLGGIPVRAKTYAVDSEEGELIWEFNGGGGLTGAVIGANDRVYFGSTVSPYFFCVDADGNGDGTTTLKWAVKMEGKTEESVPALYNGKAYVLNAGGYLYCIK